MALIRCPECNKEISDMSDKCNYCGYPIAIFLRLEKVKCDYCGTFNSKFLTNCISCGALINNKYDVKTDNNKNQTETPNIKIVNDNANKQANIDGNNKKSDLTRLIGLTNFLIAGLFIWAVLKSQGGIEVYTSIFAGCWFMIWCGIFNTFFWKKKWASIASIIFYCIGIMFNLMNIFNNMAHIFFIILFFAFLIYICKNLNYKE